MTEATRKTYELLTEFYIDRDMEVELSDSELLESLGINFDEFKDYVKESKKIHRRHIAKCEILVEAEHQSIKEKFLDEAETRGLNRDHLSDRIEFVVIK